MSAVAGLPFAFAELDRLLGEAGIDVLIASSKHNLRYLLGGHHHPFFDYTDAVGVSRYLPLLVYPRGRPDAAVYIANRNEKDLLAARMRRGAPLWVADVRPVASGSVEAMTAAVAHVASLGPVTTIGIEAGFLPFDAGAILSGAFPEARLIDAIWPLETLRAIKTLAELSIIQAASERVVDAMLDVFATHGPGTTKRELIDALRQAEVQRGLTFEYCLATVGTDLNRAASEHRWEEGGICSLDSGGNLDGYLGDLCRMAILGDPDAELEDLLGEITVIQTAARQAILAGLPGGEVTRAGQAALARSPSARHLTFVAHGMGLIGHEAPRLTDLGPIPYPATHAAQPLAAGMVLSIETTMAHPRRGFIKLEDTVAVTADGHVGFGDAGRGWNRGGVARPA